MQRGHPWLVGRKFWTEILEMRPPESPREFMARRSDEINYVIVETPTVIQDLDTPADYERARPRL
jgi:CTP:molybdopterin cytidylyltransferase MocA